MVHLEHLITNSSAARTIGLLPLAAAVIAVRHLNGTISIQLTATDTTISCSCSSGVQYGKMEICRCGNGTAMSLTTYSVCHLAW